MDRVPKKYRNFSPEFREEAARMVVETSRPIADVARELGISETSLGNWVRVYREKHAEDEPPLQLSERARLRGAGAGEPRAGDGEHFPEKSRGVLCQGASVSEKYAFVDAEYANNPGTRCFPAVAAMCRWLEVSKSGFYEWRGRAESAAARRGADLAAVIIHVFEHFDGTLTGDPRIAAQLARSGIAAGPELVRRLMRDLGLVPLASRGPGGSAHHRPGAGRADPGPGEPRLQLGRARAEDGRRHYVYPDVGRVGISRYGY